MSEQTLCLPDHFSGSVTADVHLFFYETDRSSKNNKVCFKQNLLCFMLDGQKQATTQGGSIAVDNSGILLLQTGNTLMTERTTVNNRYGSVLFLFSDAFLLDFIAKNSIPQRKEGEPQLLPAVLKKDAYLLNFERSLLLLPPEMRANRQLVHLKLQEVLLYFRDTNTAAFAEFVYTALSRNRDSSFLQTIQGLPGDHLTVDELAFLCNMSVSTFKRKFLTVFQTTPKQYFLQQRMKKAAGLLRQNMRPSEVYAEIGYENLSAFSSEFKKHFGVSPKTFCEKIELLA